MIVVEDGQQPLDFKAKHDLALEPTNSGSRSPPSEDLPPTFEESTNNNLFPTSSAAVPNPPFQDAPPQFSPYRASYFTQSDGSVISHDPHLNEDGEALFRFLLSQATTPPTYHLRVRGTHLETKTRLVTHNHSHNNHHHGTRSKIKTETYTETVVDFDFRIDLTSNIITDPQFAPKQWSVHDDEPAYRGKMFQQVEVPSEDLGATVKRKADRKLLKRYRAWFKERDAKGLPPWTNGTFASSGGSELKSSRTVRQWCDDYCASDKRLKEFVYTKAVYGWDLNAIEAAIRTLITTQTQYTGTIQIKFTPEPKSSNLIYIRPTHKLSRALSHVWIKVMLWIFLIYPFIWLFKRFHSRGGGVWKVCGAGYPLKVVHVIPHQQEILVDVGTSSAPRTTTTYTEQVVGEREGAWFRRWESTMKRAVVSKKKDHVPMGIPGDIQFANPDAAYLDGYREDL